MNLQQKYNRDDYLEYLSSFIPGFKKQIRNVCNNGLQVTKEAIYIGKSEDLDLDIFELTHTSSNDARVTLATDGFKIMKHSAIYRALIVYRSNNSDNWRLSLMTATPDINEKGKKVQNISNPRRYSFFLGPEAKIHTPYDYLINKGKIKDFDDLIDRFDVELVTKEFFQKYKELYERISKHLQSDRAFSIFASRNNVDLDTFAKKLLGQIVFLYFIQRKGWLGAAKGAPISSGDKNFVRSLYEKSKKEGKHFFNDYLEYLFYDALNNKPEKSGSFYRSYFGCQIPFLNGGLFEPIENYNWKDEVLNIPDSLFSNNQKNGILDIFDLFNFTVYEDDPIDKEVSIDPEMLGKVFENLLPENLRKGKGAYYTPREIVHYMCQESIINFLSDKSEIKAEEIRDYIKTSKITADESTEIPVHIAKKAKIIDDFLAEIKIVDPAVGSGAFLVGMLHEIVKFRVGLSSIIKKRRSEYELKKQAIINSLYGVDIDPGAVEIAKLRLWLSLVVDYSLDDIDPLPNLDFKIMQGNSLIELLSPSLLAKTTDSNRNRIIEELNKIKAGYSLLTDHSEKKEKREQINILVRAIANYDIDKERKKIWNQLLSKKAQIKLFTDPAELVHLSDMEDKETRKLSKQLQELDKVQRVSATEHFEWHVNFNEVFEEDGFDVVIANPPYISYYSRQAQKIDKNIEAKLRNTYEFLIGRSVKMRINSIMFFLERGLKLLRPNATLAYIMDLNVLENPFVAIRKYVVERMNIVEIIKGLTAFENVGSGQVVFMANNVRTHNKIKIKNDLYELDREVDQEDVLKNKEFSWDFNCDSNILNKIQLNSEPLEELLDVHTGVAVNATDIGKNCFIRDSKEKNCYPLLMGGDSIVCSYCKPVYKKYLLYDKNKEKELNDKFDSYYFKNKGSHQRPFNLREIEEYDRPKIILRQSDVKLTATYSEDLIFGNYSLFNIYSRQNDKMVLKFILGLLNSKLLNFYAREKNIILVKPGKTPQIRSGQRGPLGIRQLPIKSSNNEQKAIIHNVEKILKITKSFDCLDDYIIQARLNEYEREIDQMVYKLYGLTYDEVKLVDSEFEMSRAEYEDYIR